MKAKTLVMTKAGWKVVHEFISSENRKAFGLPQRKSSDEELERLWAKMKFRNLGAPQKEYPISDDEWRYAVSDYGYSIKRIKAILDENSLSYRQDGFCLEYCNA